MVLSKAAAHLTCKTMTGPYGKASKHIVMTDQRQIRLSFRGKCTDWYILKDILTMAKIKGLPAV